jgi:hypothetical protein
MMKKKIQDLMLRTKDKLILTIFGRVMISRRLYKKGFNINFPIRKTSSKK